MTEHGTRRGPLLASLAVFVSLVLVVGAFVVWGVQQKHVDEAICESIVSNRDATRGIWEGAKALSIAGASSREQRAEISAFFDTLLEPYPPLECVDNSPVPITLGGSYELASYSPDQVPCVPFLPFTCPPPPSSGPPQTPPKGDDPPKLPAVFVDRRTRRTVVLGWETAVDEEGIVGYRLYRDSVHVGTAGPRARRAKVYLPCGFHTYAVEAVDTSGQKDALSVRARRLCK